VPPDQISHERFPPEQIAAHAADTGAKRHEKKMAALKDRLAALTASARMQTEDIACGNLPFSGAPIDPCSRQTRDVGVGD
jgi:hypothetical protein